MKESTREMPAEVAETLDLGFALGENQTFALIAGRCSAAQAATLSRLRKEGKYKRLAPRWREFCTQYLRMSGAEADRIIQYWEEFGPGYFDLAQLIRISPETYRAIEPSIREGALQIEGGSIELNVENARRLTAAVAEIRRATPAKKRARRVLSMHERIYELDKRCTVFLDEFREISRVERCGENWLQFTSVLSRMASELRRLELENGIV